MSVNSINPMFSEVEVLEDVLFTIQAENNACKIRLSQTVSHCKGKATVEWAEYLNDGFTELENSLASLKWELVAYNYRLVDYPTMNDSELAQVLVTRNLLKRKMRLINSLFNTSKQEFYEYLQRYKKNGFDS